MIKKILIALFTLILIITISIVSLIVFVDPNNFRGFISDTVKDKTGYELSINGDLRWHIWPQVSILTDSIKLSDDGVKKPILTADNMRLDVELLPLFSKKLSVKNIFIKSAVINITDESINTTEKNQTKTPSNTTTNETTNSKNQKKPSNWEFNLNKFEVADSTVTLQHNDEIINFRNINLSLEQNKDKNIFVDLKGNIDKNQQNISYLAQASVDLNQFPKQTIIDLKKLDFTYKGVSNSEKELKGNITGIFNYQQLPMLLKSQNLSFSINENDFTGDISADLTNKPYIDLQLNSNKIDLTSFLEINEKSDKKATIQQTSPVVSNITKNDNELSFLNTFNAKARLSIKQLNSNKITLNNVDIVLTNNDGIATIKNVNFDFAKGHVAVTGIANGKQKNTLIKLNTKITNIDLNTFFSQINITNDLEGLFNATGNIESNSLSSSKLLTNLHGNLEISVTDARLKNINIQSIIQNAVAQYSKDIMTPENQEKYTKFHKISANTYLKQGNLEFTTLNANSETLDVIDGSGRVEILKQDLDINLNLKMLGGWNGKSETIGKLQKLTIPLRIYGQFANLHYQLNIGKLVSDVLSDKLQERLNKLRDKLENHDSRNNSKSKTKATDILGELLRK
ncbi:MULTISPECIES: outer membrane assembly protein AsmA [unclassified Gilliamella]|uniref:outer membrane assembly protein AsmA n=1 Tax=unclassified Gilliamella TaxID=2685620 RepID=UPI001320606C|nr:MULTISPECIES: outer membrane assembly protein AsmA [unclassified Gilliamella]MWN31564.1 outer membrane assembly protein AsmA [Gilliamella sp. Pra-s60]MWP28671.1 outer membrane assembly protein AsmA [Gilliamella sp. Pra-s54]